MHASHVLGVLGLALDAVLPLQAVWACRSLSTSTAREEGSGGFAPTYHIIRSGQRRRMARADRYPVLGRENVTLLVMSHVDRLTLQGNRVTGVEINRNGRPVKVAARSEAIVCAGVSTRPSC
jgi:choline dehydrogenase